MAIATSGRCPPRRPLGPRAVAPCPLPRPLSAAPRHGGTPMPGRATQISVHKNKGRSRGKDRGREKEKGRDKGKGRDKDKDRDKDQASPLIAATEAGATLAVTDIIDSRACTARVQVRG